MKKIASAAAPVIAVDKRGPQFLYRQIYEAFRQAIVNGSLLPGQRVPSTRVAAADFGISRVPVLNAYAQLLAEGYFESRVGSGTVVSRSLPGRLIASRPSSAPASVAASHPRRLARRCSTLPIGEDLDRHHGQGAFAVGQVAYDHFPFQIWNRLVTRHCRKMGARSLAYGDALGAKTLREVIATHLRTTRGLQCDASQIAIVSGSQQGLELTARLLLDPGDRVWMEDPGYRFARNVFASSGCPVIPIPVDAEGLNVAAGIKKCRKARAALVTPSHHFPLGVTMSAPRRLQLLDWAESSGAWIIEDDYDSEHRYEGMPITSLQGLDRHSRVVYIGTFSKVLFPSLRLGYVVLPPDLVDRFRAVRRAMDICPPAFHQDVLADFIAEGHFSRHISRMRLLYAERRSALIQSIRKELGSEVRIAGAQAGMYLSIIVERISDPEIADRAALQKLWLVPLSPFYLGKAVRQGFVLGFGSTPLDHIPASIRHLRTLLRLN